MRLIESIRRYWFLYICTFALALLLVACGSTPGSSGVSNQGNGTTGSNPSPTPGSGNGYGTANGCPSNVVVASGAAKANVTVNATQINQTIPAHNGDIIEIRLPFGHKWTGPTTSQGILQVESPAGYVSKNDTVCIWRFVAKGTGTVQLVFHSQPLCQVGQVCPMYITVIPFEFDVK